jgi:hypothetical protein
VKWVFKWWQIETTFRATCCLFSPFFFYQANSRIPVPPYVLASEFLKEIPSQVSKKMGKKKEFLLKWFTCDSFILQTMGNSMSSLVSCVTFLVDLVGAGAPARAYPVPAPAPVSTPAPSTPSGSGGQSGPSSNSSFSESKKFQVLLVHSIFKTSEPCLGISMGSPVAPGVAAPVTWFPRSRVLALCVLCALIFLGIGFASGFGAGWAGHENLTTPRRGGSTTPVPATLEVIARAGRNMTPDEDYTDAFN